MRFSYRHLLLAGLIGLSGCQLFSPSPDTSSYPVSPPATGSSGGSSSGGPSMVMPTSNSPAPTPTLVKVPADAQTLSSGAYPPPAFTAPSQAGLIEVIDMDGDPTVAVATTAVAGTGGDASRQMSITDVTNMSVSLNKNHNYRIVFVPKSAGQ